MTLPEPTIVFRSRLQNEAALVVSHFRDAGLNAALAPEDIAGPLGASPIAGPIYGVIASGCTEASVRAALASFPTVSDKDRLGANFCYHCGAELAALPGVCPECGKEVDTDHEAENGG